MKTTQETWQRCCCCHPVCLWWRYQPSIHPSIQYHRISQERFVALFGLFIQKYYKKKNNGKCQHSEWIGMTKSRNNHWINIAILVCYSIIHLRRTRFDSIWFDSIQSSCLISQHFVEHLERQGEYCQGVFPTSDIECNLLNLYLCIKIMILISSKSCIRLIELNRLMLMHKKPFRN